jgi:hypothetical protein
MKVNPKQLICQATVTSWHEENLIEQKPHRPRTPINLSYPTNTTRRPAQGIGERYEQSRLDRSTGRRNALGHGCSSLVQAPIFLVLRALEL